MYDFGFLIRVTAHLLASWFEVLPVLLSQQVRSLKHSRSWQQKPLGSRIGLVLGTQIPRGIREYRMEGMASSLPRISMRFVFSQCLLNHNYLRKDSFNHVQRGSPPPLHPSDRRSVKRKDSSSLDMLANLCRLV